MVTHNDLFGEQIPDAAPILPPGARHLPGYLDMAAQVDLARDIAAVVARAPFYVPTMPRWGTPLSVRMTNCGPLGWVTDKRGYRYQSTHPETGAPWPAMPAHLCALWDDVLGAELTTSQDAPGDRHIPAPQACLVNWYSEKAKMGLHVDSDEQDFAVPVVSVSLGQAATFRIGGLKRDDRSVALALRSGDVFVIGGDARRAYHGIDRLRRRDAHDACPPELIAAVPELFGTAQGPGRLNLTLRFVR